MTTLSTDRPVDVTPTDSRAFGPRSGPPEGAPSRGRARELEGYRGLVGLTIVVFHVFQYAAQSGRTLNPLLGALARFETVDILFLMSAYLLTLSYARAALDGTPARPARQFLFRRAVRILPLYWIGVTVVWAIRSCMLISGSPRCRTVRRAARVVRRAGAGPGCPEAPRAGPRWGR